MGPASRLRPHGAADPTCWCLRRLGGAGHLDAVRDALGLGRVAAGLGRLGGAVRLDGPADDVAADADSHGADGGGDDVPSSEDLRGGRDGVDGESGFHDQAPADGDDW